MRPKKSVFVLCTVIFLTHGTRASSDFCKGIEEVQIKNVYLSRRYILRVAVEYKGTMLTFKRPNDRIPCGLSLLGINPTHDFKVNITKIVFKAQSLIITFVTRNTIAGKTNIILIGKAGNVNVNQTLFYKDLQPEILKESIVSTENGKQIVTVLIKSNPFYFTWKIDNTSYTPGEHKNGIEALHQRLVDKFTFNVSLVFSSLDKRDLNHNYALRASFPKTTFYHSFRINKSPESNQESKAFQISIFGIVLATVVVLSGLLVFLLRFTVCAYQQLPRMRLPSPEPEEDDYASVYSWRNK